MQQENRRCKVLSERVGREMKVYMECASVLGVEHRVRKKGEILMQKFEEVRKKRKQQGFTLMEMLVVVMIMGFLLAMIAPRFTDFFDDAQQTLCKSNSKASYEVLQTFIFDTGTFPDNLLTLAVFNATGSGDYDRGEWYDPDKAPDDKGKDFSKGLIMKNAMINHTLNDAEADALKALGITKVAPIRQGNETAAIYPGDFVDVAEGVEVMMIGAGADGAGADIVAQCVNGTNVPNTTGTQAQYGLFMNKFLANPELAYRIVLGLGPDNELVTSGRLDQAGIGMGIAKEMGDDVNFHHAYHNIVLPRLAASVKRIATGAPLEIKVEGYDSAKDGTKIKGARTIAINTVQDVEDYDILSQCGSTWREHNQMTGEAQWKITEFTKTK